MRLVVNILFAGSLAALFAPAAWLVMQDLADIAATAAVTAIVDFGLLFAEAGGAS